MKGYHMKKNLKYNLYTALCLVMCAVPFVCMAFARTDSTTENKRLAALPHVTENGSFNTQFLPGLGEFFNDHFAFRQHLVSADAEIQSKVFKVSNVDTVVAGRDDWLYYTDDLDDYQGRSADEQVILCAAHNLALTQQYVTKQGTRFLVTIPPNKSTLYGGHMPYYERKKVSGKHNYQMLAPALSEQKVAYLDLFDLFEKQQDVLYLKRDSHWDNRGALLAYNAMMDALEKDHNDYTATPAVRTKTEIGDLGRMLYPVTADPEWNVYYEHSDKTSYVTDTKSVEDPWIEAANKESKGALLMYRDSFGNTLIPFMADAYAKSYYSKMTPYDLAADMERTKPDDVIIEKVERNIAEFAAQPPVIPAAKVKLKGEISGESADANAGLSVTEAEANMSYLQISGSLDKGQAACERVLLVIGTEKGEKAYEAFMTADEEGSYGYTAYFPKEQFSGSAQVRVVTESAGKYDTVCTQQVDF